MMAYEISLIRDLVLADWEASLPRVLPVVLPGQSPADIPEYLRPRTARYFEVADLTGDGIAELVRAIKAVHGDGDVPPPPRPSGTDRGATKSAESVEVSWLSDSAANVDLLRRDYLAQVLNRRIRDAHAAEPHTSLLINLDGAYGSGKSTLLTLLAKHLEKDAPFLIVWFDAWRHSRISPPWWALMTTLRQAVFADRKWWHRGWLRLRELLARARVSGAPFLLSFVLLLLLTGGVGALTLWLAHRFAPTTGDLVKLYTPAIAKVGFLFAGTKVASRVLLWNSAHGARLFEQSDQNPMARVAVHFDWLIQRSGKPVVFFIEDLDRCRDDFVVEFLDSVHTLVRDASRSHHGHPAAQATPASYFVVAADGHWIRQSYANAYASFAPTVESAGASLGYRFTDKLFQPNVPMPALGRRMQKSYLGSLLGVPAADLAEEVKAASAAIDEAGADEAAIVGTLGGLDPRVREAVAGEAAVALASSEAQQFTEHALRKFASLLDGNPRSIKLFLNTYSMLRSVRTLEGGTVAPDTLALWALIRVRWPSIADHLERNPDAVDGIKDELWVSDHFPEALHKQARNKDLDQVVMCATGGPLRADLIRQCSGTTET